MNPESQSGKKPPELSAPLGDRYKLEHEIGAGGMATVYAARDERHDRLVAVKILRPELASAIGSERFLREISILAKLQHPHIVGLLDSGLTAGVPYYVMPLIDGESLRVRLASEGELPLDEGIQLLRQILDALAYAHGRGLVHRDIKPENVLLSGYARRAGTSSGRWHAMLADFGIAKALTDAAGATRLTSTGMSIGTPASMSPEQAAGDPRVDHRSDLYAIGVLAYEIFAGTPPFSGTSAQHILAAHLTRVPEAPSKHRPAIPRELDAFILRCLEKNPADRWQTADNALARLDALVDSDLRDAGRAGAPQPVQVVESRYLLTDRVCRELDRATLDPAIIGAEMQYADNQIESDILLILLHGTGQDHEVFHELMTALPFRCVAPTLLGFERKDRSGVAIPLSAHVGILRSFIHSKSESLQAKTTIMVGFSSGADIALLLASQASPERNRIDGVVSLGGNLSYETCFVTRLWSRLGSGDETQLLEDLQRFGTGARSLEEWIKIHEYLVNTFRKFDSDVRAVRLLSQEIVRLFEEGGDDPFAALFRNSNQNVNALRCVWEDSETCIRLVRALRLRNLDSQVLGEHYREDSLIVESGVNHFDLLDPQWVKKHVDDVLSMATR